MENASQGQPATPQAAEAQPQVAALGAADQAPGAVKEAALEAIRKHKLKVDGQEIEVDDEELKRGYSHQRAANKMLQEGKAAKKQAEQFIQLMKDQGTLFETIKKLGHDPRKLAEEYLAQQLEDELLDPRDRKLRDAEAEIRRRDTLKAEEQKQIEDQRNSELKKKYADDYSKQFVKALEAAKLPPTKAMVARMAEYIRKAAEVKFEMTADEAAKLVKEDLEVSYKNLYAEAPADILVQLLGEQGLQKIRSYDTARVKDPAANLKTPTEQGEPRRKRDSGSRMTHQQWREFNRK